MVERNCCELRLIRFVVISIMAIFAGLLLPGNCFAETPDEILVSGITDPEAANGVYVKSGTHGTFGHDYWQHEDGGYFIYSDEYGTDTGDYYWTIDTDLDDEASSLFYSNTGSYDYDGFAALDSPDLVYDDWSFWNGTGNPVVSIYGVEAPEINVRGNGNDIDNEDDTPSFGNHTLFGAADALLPDPTTPTLTRTFTIENKGTAALTVSGVSISGDNASDFTVTASPASSVAASDSTTFTIEFTPSATGDRDAVVTINNDDSNENRYVFSIRGYGISGVALDITGISTPSEANGTYTYAGILYEMPYWQYEVGGNFYYLVNEDYSGSHEWYIAVNTDPVVNKDYLFFKGSEAGSPVGSGFSAYNGSGDPYIVEYGDDSPEIEVLGNSVDIRNNDETPTMADHTCFGTLDIDSTTTTYRDRTFTINNKGNADLTVFNVTLTGTDSADFSVTAQPSGPVAAGGSTTFTVRFEPSTTGEKTAILSFTNGDDDEGTYTFYIKGYGVTSKELIVSGIDNPTAANGTYTYLGIINEFQYWQNGSYYIYNDEYDGTRYWNIDTDTDDTDDTTWLFYIVSEAVDPAGLTGWTVNSSNTGVSGDPEIVLAGPEMDVLGNGSSIADGDTTPDTSDDTDFGSTAAASGTISKTFTIRNTGGDALALSGDPIVAVTADSGFSVSSQPSASSIAAAGNLTFTVAFDPSVIGTCTAEISIANDDSDENPYNFTIQGVGLNTAPVLDATGTMTLTSVTEDATDPAGDTVASIIASAGGDRITDADSGAAEGIAITEVTGNGAWQYNTGSGWSGVGTVSGSSALLLSDTAALRFVPAASNNNAQTATVTFSAWDQTSDSEGTKVDVSTNGGATAFSTTEATAALSVTAINDAPVITDQENLHTAEGTSLTITLGNLSVTDPDNTYPDDFTLSVQDGTNYTRSGNTITPSAGSAGGNLTVPVTVNDGTDDSGVYSLAVYVATDMAVANTDDSGEGSLRQALLDAGDGDVIDLSEVTGTITLESGLVVEKDVEIRGSGTDGIVIDGNSAGRVFEISTGATVSISDVTVTNGLVADSGGGIANAGDLTLERVTVKGNQTTGGPGGGIYNTGALTMTNCTVSGNVASGEGGGIYNMSGSTLTLNNCTIALNESSSGSIGGLYNGGDLDISNTLISDNTSADTGGSGTTGTNIANLVADGSLSGAGSGDPGLGPLQDNGGTGFTHGLSYGSIAIDAGNSATAEDTDQRGTSRPVDGDLDDNALPDIGAFEYIPGVIEFSADTYSVGESDGIVTITVVRTGTGDGAASATVATSDGTATAGSDYTAASGTLTWSDGDISAKTLAITIADDLIEEGNETIFLSLTGITGAGGGSILSAGVIIEDNDAYYTLTSTVTGVGSGSITSSPSGIDCGSDCSATYSAGTTVTLTATAGDECSAFSGWSGVECSSTGPCTIELTADTSVTAVFDLPDTDNDGVLDCNDAFPDDPGETADGDGDGIGDNADTDHDNDGMPTDWENEHGLNPLTDDAGLDPDGDGLTNLEEYETGTDPQAQTTGLGRAVLAAPADGGTEVSVTPTLETTYGDDADESVHAGTRWQIASDEGFRDVLLDITSDDHITDLTVPVGALDSYRIYYWRARYVDSDGTAWPWSEAWTFTTTEEDADRDGNGLPDDQELADGTESDLNGDGVDDLSETDMHCIMLSDDSGWTCLEDAAGGRVESFFIVDIEEIPEVEGQPDEIPYGLFGFRVVLDTPGDSVTVTKYYSVALPVDVSWYKYDSVNGWFDYTGYATFSEDRKVVSIELTDGGYGDADGVVNGVIVDPSGPVIAVDSDLNFGSSGGVCFITTVTGGDEWLGDWWPSLLGNILGFFGEGNVEIKEF